MSFGKYFTNVMVDVFCLPKYQPDLSVIVWLLHLLYNTSLKKCKLLTPSQNNILFKIFLSTDLSYFANKQKDLILRAA